MRKEPNPPIPEGAEKPDPPPGPPSLREEMGLPELPSGEPAVSGYPPPIFSNPTAQRAYEALMDDARSREVKCLASPLEVQQFMLDAHRDAIRTAFDIVTEGIKATGGK